MPGSTRSPPGAPPAPAVSWRDRLRARLGGPLDAAAHRAFLLEAAQTDVRRVRVFLPLMLVLHAVHIALFRPTAAMRETLAPILLHWRTDVVFAHAATLLLALPLTVLVYSPLRDRAARVLVALTALLYLVHGAAITGIDQLSMANVAVFVGYSLGTAVILCLTPPVTLAVYGCGLATFVGSILVFQPSPQMRLMTLPNGFTVTVVSVALASLHYAARRRDFAQRGTIERQRAELEAMNASLEGRVRAQVGEILERAKQIELLNAQLQAQVRARSTELSMALAKLARDRDQAGHLKKGVVLGERFVIDELIGEGGMGSVYSGTDRSTKERVAIKVIQASSAQQLDALHRFLREAGTVATVTHPAVVRMLHVDVSADGMLFQVQELVLGETLYQRLRADAPWPPERVARLGAVLADALATAHALGIVHRDVKPGNIMLTRTTPGLKLLDFGISKLLPGRDRDASSGSGAIVGTPGYMAPEQLSGSSAVTDRADVYAMGVLLYRMLTGALPFDDASLKAIVLRQAVEEAPDARKLLPSLDGALAAIVGRCLAMDPAARPEAKDVARHLAAFADERGAPPLDVIARDDSRKMDARDRTEMATVAAGRRTPPT